MDIKSTPERLQKAYSFVLQRYPLLKLTQLDYDIKDTEMTLTLKDQEERTHKLRVPNNEEAHYHSIQIKGEDVGPVSVAAILHRYR